MRTPTRDVRHATRDGRQGRCMLYDIICPPCPALPLVLALALVPALVLVLAAADRPAICCYCLQSVHRHWTSDDYTYSYAEGMSPS